MLEIKHFITKLLQNFADFFSKFKDFHEFPFLFSLDLFQRRQLDQLISFKFHISK